MAFTSLMWEYNYLKSVHNFFDKNRDCYGIVFERYSRTISNVITCVEPQQKSNKLTQRGWPGLTKTTEQKLLIIFQSPGPQCLVRNTETQLPRSNLRTQIYIIRLIFHWQLTDIPPTILPVLAKCRLVYWPGIGWCIGWHVHCRISMQIA